MTDLVNPSEIESIVGAPRHATDHLGRAVSAEQTVYILHSEECRASGVDLRECPYSVALDLGIESRLSWSSWRRVQDRPVRLHIHYDGWLVPDLMALRGEPDWPSIARGGAVRPSGQEGS